MIKVKIKTTSVSPPKRHDILCIASKFKVKFSRLQEVNDIFLLWCIAECDVDALFSTPCIEAFEAISCTPQLPPEMKAKRTLFLKNVNELVCRNNNAILIADLQQRNKYLTISDLFVFTKSATIKITYETVAMANKAKETGIFMFSFFIPPRNIALEEYINLAMCYKCYSYGDHLSSACPKPKDYKICSLCSGADHTYKQCSSTEKVCINCGGSHNTLALSCPHRKKLIKDKRTASSRQVFSFATKAGAPQNTMDHLPNTYDLIAKSVMCVVVSALKNTDTPGTFEITMNHLLRANNLPNFALGGISPPVIQHLGVSLPESTTSPSSSNTAENPKGGSDQDENSNIPTPREATIYKKGNTPTLTPGNIRELHTSGHVVVECAKGSTAAFLRRLESAAINEFDQLVNIVDLKDKVFMQQVKNGRSGSSKRQLRGNTGNALST